MDLFGWTICLVVAGLDDVDGLADDVIVVDVEADVALAVAVVEGLDVFAFVDGLDDVDVEDLTKEGSFVDVEVDVEVDVDVEVEVDVEVDVDVDVDVEVDVEVLGRAEDVLPAGRGRIW